MANPFDVTEEVLKSMDNLNTQSEPNWAVIKKWLATQLIHYQNYISMGVELTEAQIRRTQGVCNFLLNFTAYMENAKEELEFRAKMEAKAKARNETPDPIKVS